MSSIEVEEELATPQEEGRSAERVPASSGASRSLFATAARHLLLLVGFAALAIVFTFPLVTDLSGSIILARGGDAWLHLWDLWWMGEALTRLHTSPFFTTYLYYPTGVSLYFHSLNIVNALLSIPLQGLVGLVSGFNLLLLLSVTLSGYTAYLLVHYLTGNAAASVVGSFVFAFSPVQSTSLELGQLDQVTMQWLPLYLLFLVRSARRKSLLDASLAGLFLALASLATWYFSLTLVIVTICFVIYELVSSPSRPHLRRILGGVAVTAGVFLVLMSPLLVPMLLERQQGEGYMVPAFGTTVYNSADLIEFFLPARSGALSAEDNHGVNLALGYTPIVLAAAGVALARRRTWLWLALFAVLLVLSLGPLLKVAGVQTGLPMPYYLIYKMPMAAVSRQPLRFDAVAMLALGVMVAFGVMSLPAVIRRWRPGWGGMATWAVPVVAGGLILFEFLPLPRPVQALAVNPFYESIAGGDRYAIMEIPSPALARAMFEQTVHGKAIVGGYTSRHFPYPFAEDTPGVRQLFLPGDKGLEADIFSPATKDVAQDVLHYHGIRYVVVHKDAGQTGKLADTWRAVETIFAGRKPEYEDGEIAAYRVQPSGTAPAALAPVEGWYDVEGHAGGTYWRWTNGDAKLDVISLADSTETLHLNLTAHSFHGERFLEVYLDGRLVAGTAVGEAPITLSVPLDLQPGRNTVRLISLEAPETPAQLGFGADDRLLAIGFTSVEVAR